MQYESKLSDHVFSRDKKTSVSYLPKCEKLRNQVEAYIGKWYQFFWRRITLCCFNKRITAWGKEVVWRSQASDGIRDLIIASHRSGLEWHKGNGGNVAPQVRPVQSRVPLHTLPVSVLLVRAWGWVLRCLPLCMSSTAHHRFCRKHRHAH